MDKNEAFTPDFLHVISKFVPILITWLLSVNYPELVWHKVSCVDIKLHGIVVCVK